MDGGVGAEGGGDQGGVVSAEGVLDEGNGLGAGHEGGECQEDGTPFGGGAVVVEAGERVGFGAGRPEEKGAGLVRVRRAAVPAGGDEPLLPHRGAVGGVPECGVQPGSGDVGQHGGISRRRKEREVRASSGPAWECRGSSTTVSPG